ncbi:hypothetical protein BVY02_01490 [bacterium J17]|nr:hypothetical protein BVY02_01490 [bacterium J17]
MLARKFVYALVIGCLVIAAPQTSKATSIADLINNNGNIMSGNLLFNNFTYASGGNMPLAADVQVIAIAGGIRFQGPFVDLFGGAGSDALITFDVSSKNPGVEQINGVSMTANTEIIGTPGQENGFVGVTETFLPGVPNASLEVFDVEPGGEVLFDSLVFAQGYDMLSVQKDILAIAGALGSTATLSFIDQTFTTTDVPEPGSMMLLLSGILGASIKRKKSVA